MRKTTRTLALLALVSAAAACAGDSPEASSVLVRDSAGIRVVEQSAHATPAERWSVDFEGGTEYALPDGDVPLFRVTNALRLDDGRVIVADAGNNRVVAFDADGSMLSHFGSQGNGPGEFRNMMVMRRWIGDSLVVWDDRARRVSVLAPDATFARSFRLDLPEELPFVRVLGTYPDGSFMAMSFPNLGEPAAPGLRRAPIRLHHFDNDGAHLTIAGDVPGTEVIYSDGPGGGVPLYQPHFFRSGNHLAGDHLLVAPNDSWELNFRAPAGETRQIVRWLKEPTPVTADATAASLDRLLERTPEDRRGATRDAASSLDLHATMPAFDRVFYDRVGRVWLQDYEPDPSETVGWTVVGPEGELLADIELPASILLRDAGPDWLLARVLDELDVEHLMLAQIEVAGVS